MTTVSAKERDTKTTGDINKLRVEGLIPGILYGGNKQNQKISLNKNSLKKLIHSENKTGLVNHIASRLMNTEIKGNAVLIASSSDHISLMRYDHLMMRLIQHFLLFRYSLNDSLYD